LQWLQSYNRKTIKSAKTDYANLLQTDKDLYYSLDSDFSLMLLSCSCENRRMREQSQTTDPYLEQFKELLTPFELEHGIGPITERMSIDDEINEELSIERAIDFYR
jgi:hypothetical protein